MEDCKDNVSSFEGLLEDSFSFTLADLEIILFAIIIQISKDCLLTKDEQDLFFLGEGFFQS